MENMIYPTRASISSPSPSVSITSDQIQTAQGYQGSSGHIATLSIAQAERQRGERPGAVSMLVDIHLAVDTISSYTRRSREAACQCSRPSTTRPRPLWVRVLHVTAALSVALVLLLN